MQKNIVVIEGDGIGPEVTRQAIKVLNAVAEQGNHEFNFTYHLMGACAIDKTGNPLPDETIEASGRLGGLRASTGQSRRLGDLARSGQRRRPPRLRVPRPRPRRP